MQTVIIVLVLVFVGAVIYYNRRSKSLDINQDGKVTAKDAKVAVEKAAAGAKADATKASTAIRRAAARAKGTARANKTTSKKS